MNRRDFSRITGLGAFALHAIPAVAAESLNNYGKNKSSTIPLGIANHSLRAMKPNALELIDFAIKHRLDSVQFNTLTPFERLDEDHLHKIKKLADDNDITIYVGVGSISEKSVKFSDHFGSADDLVKLGIRVAGTLGSPILGVRIGMLDDRYTEGGIQPKIEEVINRMRSFREPVLDAGIKFAFENHAGDTRSGELIDLIEATGTDICGAFYDPGNATYGMEDPKEAMRAIGKYIICSQARDVMIWPSETGASFQWTAIGEGLMDFEWYTQYLGENCPGVPIHIETISNSLREIPFLESAYWKGFPDLPATGMIDFLRMVRMGHPIKAVKIPPGRDKKAFEYENQVSEFLKSANYLRDEFGVGLKNQNRSNV